MLLLQKKILKTFVSLHKLLGSLVHGKQTFSHFYYNKYITIQFLNFRTYTKISALPYFCKFYFNSKILIWGTDDSEWLQLRQIFALLQVVPAKFETLNSCYLEKILLISNWGQFCVCVGLHFFFFLWMVIIHHGLILNNTIIQ